MILKKLWNTFGRKWFLKNCGTLSRGFGPRSFRPKLTNLNILRIGKSVFVFEFVFVLVESAFTVNLRPKKTPQAEISGGISGQKVLRPKPLESVPPQFFLPLPPSLSNKAGWAYRSKLLRDKKWVSCSYCYLIKRWTANNDDEPEIHDSSSICKLKVEVWLNTLKLLFTLPTAFFTSRQWDRVCFFQNIDIKCHKCYATKSFSCWSSSRL